ncbi:MAG TPA: RlpA-like double-psi beta-barrel domain-containing protein [Actinomycetota bacterium]|nr:RlpA-like double-psi beta-barrel domain-containing protein [Actinomycetota bacterium]
MSMKVGRGGIVGPSILGAAILLSTSMAAAFAVPSQSPNLYLRLPGRAPSVRLADAAHEHAVAWIVGGSGRDVLRAAHAVLGELTMGPSRADLAGRLVNVTVRVGKRARLRVITNARTVGSLIRALDLHARGRKIIAPDRATRLKPHAVVRVTVVREFRQTVTEDVPFETLIHYSRDLASGQVKVLTPGKVGRARRTYQVTTRNGVRESATLLAETILRSPVAQVELHGAPTGAAVSTGVEYGQATWYGCDGMHAAHKTLPFGTLVTVTNLDNGRTVTVTINDRGPYAEGRIIDLCDGAFAQIAPLDQGVANVKITY